MIEVELPDGSIAEFPDSMTPEQIQTVLAQQFPQPAPAPPIPEPMGVPQEEPGLAQRAALTGADVARSFAHGATMGGSDELVARINDLRGKGTYEENLAQERAKLANVSPYIRIPGEAIGMMGATAAIPGAMGPGILRNVGVGAATGGAFGFGTGEGGLPERAQSAAIGAGAGGAGGLLGGLLGRVVSPQASQNPAVQRLMREGVTPTPGQLASTGGPVGRGLRHLEEGAASIPMMGEAIRSGQNRAIEQFNKAAINRALAPTGQTVSKVGYEAIDEGTRHLSKAWDDVLKGVDVTWDPKFAQDITGIVTGARRQLDKAGFENLTREMDNLTSLGAMKSPTVKARDVYAIVSKLGKDVRKLKRSDDLYRNRLGDVLEEVQDVFLDQIQRSAPAEKTAKLAELRAAYPNWLIVQRAASQQGAREGVFSPSQFMSATRQMDPTRNKSLFARGIAKGQELGWPAKEILGANLPNSGTADRAMIAALLGTGGGLAIDPTLGLAVGAGAAAGSLPYTPLLQKAIAAGMATRPAGAPAAARAAERLGLGLGLGAASAYTGP